MDRKSEQGIEGRCLCGRVTLELTPPTDFCSHCHCETCRRAHSAPLVTWTSVPTHRLEVTGGRDALSQYQSSGHATRSFCRYCGTQLLYTSTQWPGKIYIPVACLTSPLDRPIDSHVNYDEKVDWLDTQDALPKQGNFATPHI